MKVLAGCEWSGEVRDAFTDLGHDAWSCDLTKGYGRHQDRHIQGDVLDILDEGWDLAIFFPPCTYLTNSNVNHRGDSPYREYALWFVSTLLSAPIDRIALENPPGAYNNERKPDQIFEPWYFGEPFTKRTCLWLKNLLPLQPENACHPGDIIGPWTHHTRSPTFRGKTFTGVARAMANQWGKPWYI